VRPNQLGDSFEEGNSISHLSDEQRDKSRVSSPSLQGISRTTTQLMPNRYFDIPANVFKAEIWIRLAGLYDADYVVVIDGIGIDVDVMGSAIDGMDDVSGKTTDTRSCYLKKPMLISVGEISDDAQKRRQNWMSSFEGLNVSESLPELRDKSTELLVKGLIELFGVINDEESETLFIAGRRVDRRHLTKGMNEVIECRPQIVDAVADNQRPADKVRRRTNPQHSHPYSGHLRATLEKGLITATIEPSTNFSVNRLEVFFSAV
jgi:hypothetical protein